MDKRRKQVATIVLYIVSLIGILPALILTTSYFGNIPDSTVPLLSSITQQLSSLLTPTMPVVFALLFILGVGLSIFLARKWFLILLLPLLYLALMPFFTALDKKASQPFVFYGQTEPGVGFERYITYAWSIQITYPEHVKKRIKLYGKQPIVTASLGGRTEHWMASGVNSIYPYEINKTDWSSGFSLYLQNLQHTHRGNNKKTDRTAFRYLPEKLDWFVSYIVVIPED